MNNMEQINGKWYFTANSIMADLKVRKTKAHEILSHIEKEIPFAVATINKNVKTKNGQNRKIPTKIINPNYYEAMISTNSVQDPIEIQINKELEQLQYASKKELLNEIKKRDYQIVGLEETISQLKHPFVPTSFKK